MSENIGAQILAITHARELPALCATLYVLEIKKIKQLEWMFLNNILDTIESKRAAAFRFADDANTYIAAHGLRRLVLGNILNFSPAELQFKIMADGKPIVLQAGGSFFDFSISHTKDCVALCVSKTLQIGVDIEPSSRILPPVESWLTLGAHTNIPKDFHLDLWCKKEALSKALGLGSRIDFKKLNILPEAPAELLKSAQNKDASETTMEHFHIAVAGVPAHQELDAQLISPILYGFVMRKI